MFLQLKNANTIHFKKNLYSIVVKKMYTRMSSVHGSSVLTVIEDKDITSCKFLLTKQHHVLVNYQLKVLASLTSESGFFFSF